ncbi:glyoxalase [Streptomyces sp. SKN60]|uniref:VOC family protein n=1 Tax=Streptomyces sp. SKN60 TaxID=2855506 RepID=UPI002246ACF0|nr:VOC family protein [Streptomyces sp. SKN60]MCX2182276.1 glyoxalase [Streptomyces sp. SKN60]
MAMNTVIFPVKDLERAKALLTTLLGTAPSVDAPYYVGFDVDGQHFGLDPNGHGKGLTGPVPFWDVDDLDGLLQGLLAAGATTVQEVQEVGGGMRITTVKDPDGNMIGLRSTAG